MIMNVLSDTIQDKTVTSYNDPRFKLRFYSSVTILEYSLLHSTAERRLPSKSNNIYSEILRPNYFDFTKEPLVYFK